MPFEDSTNDDRSASPGLLARTLDLLLPSPCLACSGPVSTVRPVLGLCPGCRERLDPDPPRTCSRCGEPDAAPDRPGGCARCRTRRFPWRRMLVVDLYRPPLDDVLRAFKFRKLDFLASSFAARALERRGGRIRESEVIVPVPLHWRRRLDRGFDQADRIAREIGRAAGLPCCRGLRRHRATRAQTSLDRRARSRNLAGAFRLGRRHPDLRDRRVLLVDDVLTTGATLEEAARTLRGARPAALSVLVLARAPSSGLEETRECRDPRTDL